MSTVSEITSYPVWRTVLGIAESVYALIRELPEEEQWDMAVRLHQHAFGVTNEVSAGLGALNPQDKKYNFSRARSHLFAIKNSLVLGYKVKELSDNAETIIAIDKAIEAIDDEMSDIDNDIQKWYKTMQDQSGQQR